MSRNLAAQYSRLGLSPGATRDEVVAAFRACALREHPDVGGCAASFQEVQAARDALLACPVSAREPASVRMYRYRGRGEHVADKLSLLGSVVVPTGLGMLVGLRLLYQDDGNRVDGTGVRAGGNSRVRMSELRPPGHLQASYDVRRATTVSQEEELRDAKAEKIPLGGGGVTGSPENGRKSLACNPSERRQAQICDKSQSKQVSASESRATSVDASSGLASAVPSSDSNRK